jgi:DNA-binding CsgD family transcriptional regulator
MPLGASAAGLLLLDVSLKPLAANDEALKILTFPTKPERIRQIQVFLGDKVRSSLVDRQAVDVVQFVREYKSGNRRYMCRAFQLDANGKGPSQAAFVLVLERYVCGGLAIVELAQQFALTSREVETVQYLVQGLTSKEIATRMNISPNTVKAFLRLVMVKLGVSTRSGIAGKVFGPRMQA